jgi:transcription antitermination factor NusG
MNENKNWYAVYTRPRWEKKVAEQLTRKNVENYCPLNRVLRKWSDRKKVVQEPLFTTYVFVKASEAEMATLRQTDGVVNLVYWLNKPAVIPEKEIEAIRVFLQEHSNVTLQKTSININDRIRIIGGPLVAHEGHILAVKKRSVKVSLPSLGYMMQAEVETLDVEVIQHRTAILHQQDVSYSLPVAR